MQRGRFNVSYEQIYLDAKGYGIEEQLEEELYSFAKLVRDHFDFKLFLEDPRIAADYKKRRLKEICPAETSQYFFVAVHNLIDHGRADMLEDLSWNFTRDLFQDKGTMFGQVSSVCEIPPEMRERLLKVMGKEEGSPVKLRYELDPDLLGGLCVKLVNGDVWDVSLRHKLDDLKAVILS